MTLRRPCRSYDSPCRSTRSLRAAQTRHQQHIPSSEHAQSQDLLYCTGAVLPWMTFGFDSVAHLRSQMRSRLSSPVLTRTFTAWCAKSTSRTGSACTLAQSPVCRRSRTSHVCVRSADSSQVNMHAAQMQVDPRGKWHAVLQPNVTMSILLRHYASMCPASRLKAVASGHGDAVVVMWIPAAATQLSFLGLTAGCCAASVLQQRGVLYPVCGQPP